MFSVKSCETKPLNEYICNKRRSNCNQKPFVRIANVMPVQLAIGILSPARES